MELHFNLLAKYIGPVCSLTRQSHRAYAVDGSGQSGVMDCLLKMYGPSWDMTDFTTTNLT